MITVQFNNFMEYAKFTNYGKEFLSFNTDIQGYLNDLFSDGVAPNPDDLYLNSFHEVDNDYIYNAIDSNEDLSDDYAFYIKDGKSFEDFCKDYSREIISELSDIYEGVVLGYDKKAFWALY